MPPTPAPQSAAAAAAGGTPENEYDEALEKLQPLQPVLRGFNHRNRNQHRRAAWWAAFGMLRRHVDKCADELLDAAAAATKSRGKKKRRRDDGAAEVKVQDHVVWLRDVLVPKCYVAFSQLTADNQFATLGVVLLGALAQVNTACTQLAGEAAGGEAQKVQNDNSSLPTRGPDTRAVKEAGGRELSSRVDHAVPETSVRQGGTVISRDQVAQAEKLRRKNVQAEGKNQSGYSSIPDGARKDKSHDHDATPVENRHSTASKAKTKEVDDTSSKEVAKPAKKKKKTKKNGDEFDALFKGLF
ncbi:hypothetical protein F4804DRAFT_302743 [Jackrogersella minutella]|nr:hypothetical protein F4804DRAFT_302743 [Jackrogersella minutella]